MLERLEKFHAPASWHAFIPGAIMIVATLIACNIDYSAQPTNEKVTAEAAERAEIIIPLSHPLGCPRENDAGRPLTATLSIQGERHPRCYYGP